ncbi:uncharacterized protein KD926_011251 [Aspergillus affinis]|uniref:uncharacterized protein n=1 Tax=Aspergillus affinis TaxID=1070780 RepID=UPI0022FEA345|nr:uncharacterized protein KD926_011251 [Aspergillus affinis]KAI9038117.1 hypothetical protein KD926_011251 [Aspergillus affinis]
MDFVQGGILSASHSTTPTPTTPWYANIMKGFNTAVDLFLTILSAIQLWRFTIRATDSGPSGRNSFLAKLHNMPRQTRIRRMWQTITLSGPLLLSGIASIVKTYLLKSIGDKNDITHSTVPFVLWVKIENYSILLDTCASVVRLLIRMSSESYNQTGSLWSRSRSNQFHEGSELIKHDHTHSKGTVVMSIFADRETSPNGGGGYHVGGQSGEGQDDRPPNEAREIGGVRVKTDITVQVDSDGASTKRLVP